MAPYFFDIVTCNRVLHDFTGRLLENFDDARAWAELLALDIEDSDDVWDTTGVLIRDVRGEVLYSAPIQMPDLH